MTIAIAWVGQRLDGRRHLYMASDSRTRGYITIDFCPKILTLPRSDSAICFAGEAIVTYPLMIHLANAIEAHPPARERSMDIAKLKDHLLEVFNDFIDKLKDVKQPLKTSDIQFIFGGYSWRAADFRLWKVQYSAKSRTFEAAEAKSFHKLIEKAAFVGDYLHGHAACGVHC